MDKWYVNSYRRNLVDMHISEYDERFLSKFDPVHYVQNLKKAHVQTAYIYTSNCLGVSFFPTKIGHPHNNLNGRDLVAEVIDECNKNDIMPIIYTNYWSLYAYEQHPDWRCVTPDGKTSMEYYHYNKRFGVCCMNSPFQKYMEDRIEEVVARYQTQGIWIDMTGTFMMCTCDHCKKRFFEETGFEIPEKINWNDEVWQLFIKKRYDWVAESLAGLNAAAKRAKSDIVVVHNSARYVQNHTRCLTKEYFNKTEFVAGDYNSGRPYHSFFSKLFYQLSQHKPAEFLCPVMKELTDHNVMRTKNDLLTMVFSSMANNVRFGFIDALDPIGTVNDAVYDRMKEVYEEQMKFEKYLTADTEVQADIGVYCSLDCPVDEDENGMDNYSRIWDTRHIEINRDFAALLKKVGLPYKVITPNNLDDLKTCKLLLLSELNVISDEEKTAFETFVKEGGSLYASGEIGTYDENYKKVEKGLLSDVLGVEPIERDFGKTYYGDKIYYISPTEKAADKFEYFTETHPLSCGKDATNYIVKAKEGAEIWAYITYPYKKEGVEKAFSSAISTPPWGRSENPALVFNRYGKGKALYSSYPLEMMKKQDQNKVLKNLLVGLLPEDTTFKMDVPEHIEVTFLKQTKTGNYLLNVLNDQMAEENLPIYDLKISVKTAKPKKVIDAETEKEATYQYKDGYLTVTVDKIKNYKMYIIKFN